jgi:hypothetical protein
LSERIDTGRSPAAIGFKSIGCEKDGGRAAMTFIRPEVLIAVHHPLLEELKLASIDAS